MPSNRYRFHLSSCKGTALARCSSSTSSTPNFQNSMAPALNCTSPQPTTPVRDHPSHILLLSHRRAGSSGSGARVRGDCLSRQHPSKSPSLPPYLAITASETITNDLGDSSSSISLHYLHHIFNFPQNFPSDRVSITSAVTCSASSSRLSNSGH